MRSRVGKLAMLGYGVASLVPDVTVRAVLIWVAIVVMFAAIFRFPRRLFPKPTAS